MKIFYLLFFVCLLSVDAQRRSAKSELSSENESRPVRRGRTRFAVPTELVTEEPRRQENVNRKTSNIRKRPETGPDPVSVRKSYEVQEIIDELPARDQFRKPKPRVVTENIFEARNAPPTQLFQPSGTENTKETLRNIDIITEDMLSLLSSTIGSTSTAATEAILDAIPQIEEEVNKIQPESTTSTTSTTTKTSRKNNIRVRNHLNAAPAVSPTAAPQTRSRSPVRKSNIAQESSISTPRSVVRSGRRRAEGVTPKVSQETSTASSNEKPIPVRSRTGRKIITNINRYNNDKTVDKTSNTPQRKKEVPEKTVINPRKSNLKPNVEATTTKVRSRSRFRDTTPLIDAQKLEVLPLFERETRTVKPIRQNQYLKQRNLFHTEAIEMSATENDITVVPKPPKQSVIIETRTESSIQRRKPFTKKPAIKETVISQISEVTSKRTITRKSFKSNKIENTTTQKAKVVAIRKNNLSSSSEEDVEESDNYPPQFKALLQAKKGKQGPKVPLPQLKKQTKIVTSSVSTTIKPIITSEAIRQVPDSENELEPSSSPRPTPLRRRFSTRTPKIDNSLITNVKQEKLTVPTRKSKTLKTANFPISGHREQFHAKFNNNLSTTAKPISLATKAYRDFHSHKNTKDLNRKNRNPAEQITVPKKTNKFSSRYRNDGSSRNSVRSSTNAPAYLPTIPSIKAATSEYVWPEEENIEYSWSFSRLN